MSEVTEQNFFTRVKFISHQALPKNILFIPYTFLITSSEVNTKLTGKHSVHPLYFQKLQVTLKGVKKEEVNV